jgi:glycosyltransferase involved in cell wall biosynthesis
MDNGILVEKENEWIEALEILIQKPELRKKLGNNARQTILLSYSTDVIGELYLKVLRELIGEIE